MGIAADITEIDRIVLHQLQREDQEVTVSDLYDKVFSSLHDLDQRIGRPDFVASIWRLVDAGNADLSLDRKVKAIRRPN